MTPSVAAPTDAATSSQATQPASSSGAPVPAEQVTASQTVRPSIQIFPHAGPVGQPRRISAHDNKAPSSNQGPWGVFTRGNGEAAGFGPVGVYGVAPWAEDWSYLRDKSLRSDPLDPLKYIALNPSGTIWLSLSGETRLRNWSETRPSLGTQAPNDSGRFAVRNLYGADLHLGSHVRFFGQLINADAAGWGGYKYTYTYRKRLDVQQAFVELRQDMFGAKTGFMFGRQQFLDAPSYVLYSRETPNVPLSWNGFRAYAIWSRFRIDGYDFVQTDDSQTGMFQDTENYATRLYGFNATWAPGAIHIGNQTVNSFLDLFYIGFKLGGSQAAIANAKSSSSGSTTRNDFGFRWYGSASSFEFSVGGLWQGGDFRYAKTNQERQVSAFSVNSIVGYRYSASSLHPFIGFQTDIYSGSRASDTSGTIGTYIAPFNPQTNYFDTTTYIGTSNIVSLSPVIRLTPWHFLTFQFKSPFMWRENADAPIYTSSGIYSFARSFRGGYVGAVPQASLSIQINRHLNWTQYVARFLTSDSLNKAGGSSGTYYQSNFVFRF